MKNRIKLVLVFLIILVGSFGLIQFVRAEETTHKVFLPLIIQPEPTPVPLPIITITHWSPSPDYVVKGRVFNVNPSEARVVIYYYYPDYSDGTQHSIPEQWVTYYEEWRRLINIEPDGSFNDDFGKWGEPSSKWLKAYAVDKNYQPARNILPPNPPTEDVWAMTEAMRK